MPVDTRSPAVSAKFQQFHDQAFAAQGVLDRVTLELIALAVASLGRSEPVKARYSDRARVNGASDEQIAEALAVACGQAGGTQVFWMKDDFDELLGSEWRQEFIAETDRSFWAFKREVFADGAIDKRTKQLIAVAVSSKLRCRHCTRAHIEAAFKAGASKAEVAESLAVLWAVSSELEF